MVQKLLYRKGQLQSKEFKVGTLLIQEPRGFSQLSALSHSWVTTGQISLPMTAWDPSSAVTEQQTWTSVTQSREATWRIGLSGNESRREEVPAPIPPAPRVQARGRKTRWPCSIIYSVQTLEVTQMPGNQGMLKQSGTSGPCNPV